MNGTILENSMMVKDGKKAPSVQKNGLWKNMIEEAADTASGMSEDEIRANEARIRAKLRQGKKLSAKDMDFLRKYNPGLYRTALRVSQRKEQLAQQLKHCRSKAEAMDVARRSVSSIDPKDPDREYLAAGLGETIRQFRKSSAYARLPETDDHGRKKRGKALNFEEKEEKDFPVTVTPIQEVLDELPTFDVVQ